VLARGQGGDSLDEAGIFYKKRYTLFIKGKQKGKKIVGGGNVKRQRSFREERSLSASKWEEMKERRRKTSHGKTCG